MDLVLGGEQICDPADSGLAESPVRVLAEREGAAGEEMPAATAGAARQALPAWIRSQVEELEMRRTARHGVGPMEPAKSGGNQ